MHLSEAREAFDDRLSFPVDRETVDDAFVGRKRRDDRGNGGERRDDEQSF